MAHFYPQSLLLLVLLIVISECRASSPAIKTVSASQEEDVVLPCFDSNMNNSMRCNRVKWIKYATGASQMKVILARPKTPKFQDAEHVKLEADGNGQMSLFLTKLQKSDEGLYSCEIWQGWDCILVRNISLKVKECKTLQAVKAVPSTPVNLNCPVNITSGQQIPQNFSWVMLKGGNPVLFNSTRVESKGRSLDIHSVNYTDSGWYRCKYILGQTQRCFDINLLIQVENVVVATTVPALASGEIIWTTRKEGISGAIIAIVASAIIGIAIIAALIGLFIYCRHNNQRATQQICRHPPGTVIDSTGVYEIVTFTSSDDHTNQQVNSLYQQFQDKIHH
ncbi:uncharacterized protein LOC122881407 [Siniperca chuatsi]|uniref:uncharacterized protein LOC122881407 n=1 Tax=Siniperca chuatsi TaxID=119488 RepID=UPI001CE0F6AF|nr:uncharacterized protein LOC122881407 [Siniperca chuatsi]